MTEPWVSGAVGPGRRVGPRDRPAPGESSGCCRTGLSVWAWRLTRGARCDGDTGSKPARAAPRRGLPRRWLLRRSCGLPLVSTAGQGMWQPGDHRALRRRRDVSRETAAGPLTRPHRAPGALGTDAAGLAKMEVAFRHESRALRSDRSHGCPWPGIGSPSLGPVCWCSKPVSPRRRMPTCRGLSAGASRAFPSVSDCRSLPALRPRATTKVREDRRVGLVEFGLMRFRMSVTRSRESDASDGAELGDRGRRTQRQRDELRHGPATAPG